VADPAHRIRGELPLGVFFFWLYRRIAMTTMSVLHHDTSEVPRPRRLRDFKIVQLELEALGSMATSQRTFVVTLLGTETTPRFVRGSPLHAT